MKRIVFDFFRLVRFKNLLIILITQVFSFYFISDQISLRDLFDLRFLFLIIATVFSAAAGYIINDYMDFKLDIINKPNAVIIGKTISRRWAIFLHTLFNLISVGFAYAISLKVVYLVIVCSVLLWLYSQYFKKTYLIGNILVALMTASTIFILIPFDSRTNIEGCVAYSIFAFFSNFIREIIKDAEDIRGDEKFNAKTLPIVIGLRNTQKLLLYLQILFVLGCVFFLVYFHFVHGYHSLAFAVFMTLFVIIPSLYAILLIKKADTKKHFTQLSFLTKMVMICGILSMYFWR